MNGKKQAEKSAANGLHWGENPIPEKIYPVLDTDLARDNLENDLSAADLQDLRESGPA